MAKKVLVIDDNKEIVSHLAKAFSDAGFDTVEEYGGLEAYSKVYEHAPDLIILDVLMPDIGGYELCRMLKADDKTSKIPVIIYTQLEKNIDKFWAYRSGANGFIHKDDDLSELIKTSLEIVEAIPVTLEYKSRLIGACRQKSPINAAKMDFIQLKELFLEELKLIQSSDMEDKTLAIKLFRTISKVFKYDCAMLYFNDNSAKKTICFDTGSFLLSDNAVNEIKKFVSSDEPDEAEFIVISKRDGECKIDNTNEFSVKFEFDMMYENNICGKLSLYTKENMTSSELKLVNTIKSEIENIMRSRYSKLALKDGEHSDNPRKLYNRMDFDKLISHEISWHKRNSAPMGLILIEIDNLNTLMNILGDYYCDVLIAKVSTILTECLCDTDFIYRNDENIFLILMTNADRYKIDTAVELMRTKVQDPCWLQIPEQRVKINCSSIMYDDKYKNHYEFIDAAYDALDDMRYIKSGDNK